MNVKQFKRKFLHGMVEPELFYLPVESNKLNTMLTIKTNQRLNDETGHSGGYLNMYHGYWRSVSLNIYSSLINSSTDNSFVQYGEYTSKVYKQVGSTTYYHILNENNEIVGECVFLTDATGFRIYNFQITIDSQSFCENEIILFSSRVSATSPTSPRSCHGRNGLINSYIYCNPYAYIGINNVEMDCYLKKIHPTISDELLITVSSSSYGYIYWWIYINIDDKTVRSRYYLADFNDKKNEIERFNLSKSTDVVLFNYQ